MEVEVRLAPRCLLLLLRLFVSDGDLPEEAYISNQVQSMGCCSMECCSMDDSAEWLFIALKEPVSGSGDSATSLQSQL